ncbi:MAG: hypothetical protein NTV21_12025 [Planctomycetota bacterium]|nr:hypothetical protein [Planctomycetota bacterium]
MSGSSANRNALARWALVALTLWTLLVRLYGVDFGVPCLKEADTFIADHVRMLREGKQGDQLFDRALSACQYPSLLATLAEPLSDATLEPPPEPVTLKEHLAAAARVWVDLRTLVAVLSVLVVPGTFFIARRFASERWALFAAALVSFSLLHVMFSQEARAHGAVVGFSACAVACALWLRRTPSTLAYVATAIFAAFAVGTLHNGLAVLAPIGVAQLARRDRRWWDLRMLVVLALAAASFRTFYWYYFDEAAQKAMAGDDATQGVLRDLPFDGTGFLRLARTIWYYEPALTLLVAVACGTWLARKRLPTGEANVETGDALVVLSYVVPYLLLAGLFNQTYERFLLSLLPFLATFAAWALERLSLRARAVAPAALLLLALPLAASTKLSWMRGQGSTLDDAAQWITEHAPQPEATPFYVLPPLDFPLMRTTESLRHPEGRAGFFSPWSRYQNKLADERRVAPLYRLYWISGKPEFGALESDEEADAFLRSHGPGFYVSYGVAIQQSPERAMLVASMRRVGTRVARFSPDGDPEFTNHQLWDQDVEADGWPHVTWRVLRARTVGPVIEVFELR